MTGITLSVLRCPDAVVPGERRATGGEISLGRGADCDWPLEDPERVLSKKHCVVEFYGGGWQLRDLSTNGTFVNHGAEPVGRDQVRPLLDGDRLRLGSYEIEVRIEQDAAGAGFGGAWDTPAPRQPAPTPAGMGFGGGEIGGGFTEDDARGFGGGGLLPDDVDFGVGFTGPTQPDHAPPTAAVFTPPTMTPAAKAVIPDEWDLDFAPPPPRAPEPVSPMAASPVSPAAASPRAEPANPFDEDDAPPKLPPAAPPPVIVAPPQLMQPPVVQPPVAPPPAPPVAATAPNLAPFFEGADLPPAMAARAAADPDAALRIAGEMLRAAIAGMRALLIARADVKREFRIEQTMLRATNNNPVKFAATEEQALAALLDPRGQGLKALQETVDDLTAHQVATLAATQAAARALLDRLAPGPLEAEDQGGGILPGAKEKRLWEAYRRRHAALVEQFEDDFDSAFGKAFARAYEQATGRKMQ